MIYAIGYREYTQEKGHTFNIQNHITKEEYDTHLAELSEAKKMEALTNVFNLFDRNGNEFLKYSVKIKEQISIDKDIDNDQIYLESNRLLINYLSSLSMFIDYGEKYNKKHFGKQKLKEFESKTHDFYDNHVSYRFMAIMRNYALHYGFPLSNITKHINGPTGIFASKENLLEFKSWKHVREDIEKMPNLISLDIHVEISMLFIQHLYESYVYDIAPTVLKGIEYLNNMIQENSGNLPFLSTFKNQEEFKKGNISIKIIDPVPYKNALDIIQNHPSINIDVKK
ncbi:hypothetical protein ACQRXC_07930 [Niallia taxi]|uniref:hypothetical protein n=1 Tax=Niallia taxi TaxID=2499688 RepID=UPI003F6022AF